MQHIKQALLLISILWLILFATTGWIRAWNGILADPGDILTAAKWNELVQYIDDGLANVSGWWGNLSITSVSVTVADNACLTTAIDHDRFLNAYADVLIVTPWAEINPVGTIDPDNTSTWDANLINNNYTDLVYNDSSAGSTNKSLPAVDLGSSQSAWVVRIYWWNPNQYWVTNGQIEGSNDGTTWTPLVTNIVKTTGATGDFDDYTVSGSYRYYRLFSVAGLNATWVVISELEVFSIWSSSTESFHVFNRAIDIKNNAWSLEICNNDGAPRDIEVNHL